MCQKKKKAFKIHYRKNYTYKSNNTNKFSNKNVLPIILLTNSATQFVEKNPNNLDIENDTNISKTIRSIIKKKK